jgi:signal transduction histidine kinase
MTAGRRGLIDRTLRRANVVGLAALSLFVAIGLARRLPEDAGLALAAAATALLGGLLIDRLDARFLLPSAALGTVGVAALAGNHASYISWFAVCVFAAWCVLGGRGWEGLTYWAGSIILFAAEWLIAKEPDPGWAAWMAGTTFTVCAAALVRHEIGLVNQLRAAEAGLAERSRAEERNRIARDLHDVIAHSLTVSLLHVTSARLAVEYEPEDAAASLAEAERLGRQSLDEVRSIVGLMGTPEDDATAAPVHGTGELTELVDGFRRAGADVTLTIDGDLGRLPATTGSVVYRILQEALTNAAKHAAGRRTVVHLATVRDRVELVVDTAGVPGTGTTTVTGVGRGTPGMRERAAALGGHCTAGPVDDGWRVHAWLPLGSAPEVAAT